MLHNLGTEQDIDKHYAEGSIMPVLVNKLIFTKVPEQSPWFIRPVMSLIFGQVGAVLIDPQIKRNAEMVSLFRYLK